MHKEVNKFLIIPCDNNLSAINCTSFILPLKEYSVGCEYYFSVDEINEYARTYEVSVLINKFLHASDLENIKKVLNNLKNVKYFFIEDFGLTSIIPKEKTVLYPIHIISNYESINYLNTLGYKNVMISNELTDKELKEIGNKTNSNIFYMYTGVNSIMYSKRELLTAYYDNFNIEERYKYMTMSECVSDYKLKFREEEKSTLVFDDKIFCASAHLNDLNIFNLVVNLNNMSETERNIIIDNYRNKDLYKMLDCNNRFLEENIVYKVGDLK